MTLKNKESSKDVINRGEGGNRPGRKAFGWVSFPLRPQLWPAGVGGECGEGRRAVGAGIEQHSSQVFSLPAPVAALTSDQVYSKGLSTIRAWWEPLPICMSITATAASSAFGCRSKAKKTKLK